MKIEDLQRIDGRKNHPVEFYIAVPEFLTPLWVAEQRNRAQAIVRRFIADNDAGNRSGLAVYWSPKGGGCIAVQARIESTLRRVRRLLGEYGLHGDDTI